MRNRPLFSGCLIGFFMISLCIIIGGARFVDELRPSVLEGVIKGKTVIRLSGQVYDMDVKENYQILYLKNNSIIYQNKSFKESKIIIYDEEKLNIEIGNQLEVKGELSFYEVERNPGNFNQKLYYQKQGIRASVWAIKIKVNDHTVDKVWQAVYRFRMQWKLLLCEVLGQEDGAILSAMLLAEKSGMNEATKELYQVNGIGHVLAISGLHLSIIGVGLYKIFRRISGSFVAGGFAGIGFLVGYILMIGMSVSVLRAWIMFMFRVGADMTGRHYDAPTALCFSALVTIIWKPIYLYDGGFWLSYGAILAIIYVLPMFEQFVFQGFWSSVSIQLVTLPVLLYFYYEVPVYSVFLNMIVIPLMTAVLICGLMGSLCSSVFIVEGVFGAKGLGGGMLRICGLIFDLYEKCCELFLELPGARIVTGQPEKWQIVMYYGILFLIAGIWWRKKCFKKDKMAIVIVVFNIIMMLFPFEILMNRVTEEMSVTVVDVGQGDGIFIRGPKGNTYLIDGGSSDVKKVGQYRLEPFLKSQGVGKINYVFVSHGDSDHISGITEMIDRMDMGVAIETIVFPDDGTWDEKLKDLAYLAIEKGVRVMVMKAGQKFTEGEMKLICLAPIDDANLYKGESNVRSMVLALNYGEFDMLFTGDTEAEGEEILTEVLKEEYPKVSWEVLKVAHHGSKNSSKNEFLEEVLPTYSLISAGRENSYGHPHNETIERLLKIESIVMSTQEKGAITIVTDGKKMKLEGYVD